MILELLEQIFNSRSRSSRQDAKQRLRLILAYDRAALTPSTLDLMRQEIIAVVSKYVELDTEALEFEITGEAGAAALVANLPIRRVHAPE